MHENIFKFKRARYFYLALFLSFVCVLIYASQGGRQPANGGTWQGYTLGTWGATLIVWLTVLGIRKRSYRSRIGTLQGWVSAHVYLGTSLLIVATLHCAVQFGYNIHTLAYVLMCLVVFSGFGGVYVYMRYPSLGARNRANRSREDLFEELDTLNSDVSELSKSCDREVQSAVESAVEYTNIGGGVTAQLLALDSSQLLFMGEGRSTSNMVKNKDQQTVVDFIAKRIPRSSKKDEAANLQELLTKMCRRQTLLRKIRKDIQLHGWMQIWLYIHVPLSIALLFSLSAHILSVFFYW